MTKQSKIRWFHTLLYRTYMMKNKPDMLRSYGVKSTTDLTNDQLDELILYLEGIYNSKSNKETEEVRAWRHKVLRMVAKCGIDTQDWNTVNAFLVQPRIAGKHLYECTLEELKSLHRKLHNVAAEKVKKINKERYQAMLN